MAKVKMSVEQYRKYCFDYMGICTSCGEMAPECEPDAERYECPECGEDTVYGVEQALLLGKIEIEEDH